MLYILDWKTHYIQNLLTTWKLSVAALGLAMHPSTPQHIPFLQPPMAWTPGDSSFTWVWCPGRWCLSLLCRVIWLLLLATQIHVHCKYMWNWKTHFPALSVQEIEGSRKQGEKNKKSQSGEQKLKYSSSALKCNYKYQRTRQQLSVNTTQCLIHRIFREE